MSTFELLNSYDHIIMDKLSITKNSHLIKFDLHILNKIKYFLWKLEFWPSKV